MKSVAVLGAEGHTARFVIAELQRNGLGIRPATRRGRWRSANGEAPCAPLDFADEAGLDAALAGASAIINCAGPFMDTALPAARAAIRMGIPYLDLAAEQMAALSLFETLAEPAERAGTCIVPAMSFYGGLADLLVSAIVTGAGEVDAVEIAVGLSSWFPTRGTRLTGQRNIATRLVVRDGALQPVPQVYPRTNWHFSSRFGELPVAGVQMSEIVLLSRHVRARSITSYMNAKPLADLGNPATPPPVAFGPDGKSDQTFVMDAVVTLIDGSVRRATASGTDIYAATAPLVVTACLELIGSKPARGGVYAPGEVFDSKAFLAHLAPAITVRFD